MSARYYCDGCGAKLAQDELLMANGWAQSAGQTDQFCSSCGEHRFDYWNEKISLQTEIAIENAKRLENHRNKFFSSTVVKKKLKEVK